MHWNQHVENRSAFPEEKLRKYYGKHVAWNLEGTEIVASGEDDLEVFNAVRIAGLPTDQVVFSYVPDPDTVLIGGFIFPGEEQVE
jgi:hypothetical protein